MNESELQINKMTEIKRYIIDDEDIDEILKFIRERNYSKAREHLRDLPELET